MRKIIVSALILFVLIGLVLPASAGADDHKKSFDKYKTKPKHKEFNVLDKDINTAIVTQTQIAVPMSFDNKNTAWFGSAGTQDIYQSQYSNINQKNK